MTAPLLEIRDLTAGYGDVAIARSFGLEIAAGQVVALLGPNGAGKTTIMATIAGLLPRLAGEVLVEGAPLPNGKANVANRAGVVLVPDDRSLFAPLSVEENVQAACQKGGSRARDVLEVFPALEKRWKVAAGSLSGGEQQMLAVARAMVQQPKVLLIDEMSMGLAPVIVESLLPTVRRIADSSGAAVILVEQHVQLALEVADEAVVLVHGEVSLRGRAEVLAGDPDRLEAAYMGAAPAGTA